ncbi:MAG: RNA polymerase sigma factor [Polyangiales bacterium]
MSEPTDEELVARVVDRDEEAFRLLHARHSPLVFGIAVRSLGPAGAQEVVQDVLLTVWQKASTYDRSRGPFRPWLLQITHHRIANVLRAERRRGKSAGDEADLEDPSPSIDDEVWREHRRNVLRSAIDALPEGEKRALSLAFLDELSHEQVASFLSLPLGTAKTRIRSGLRRLRPMLAALGVVSAIAVAVFFVEREHARSSLRDRALRMVTASDVELLRLVAAPGIPPERHGNYRARPGAGLAVLTCSNLAPGLHVAWARENGAWVRLGAVEPDRDGKALLIVESKALSTKPEAIEVTLEERADVNTPTGPVQIVWP